MFMIIIRIVIVIIVIIVIINSSSRGTVLTALAASPPDKGNQYYQHCYQQKPLRYHNSMIIDYYGLIAVFSARENNDQPRG